MRRPTTRTVVRPIRPSNEHGRGRVLRVEKGWVDAAKGVGSGREGAERRRGGRGRWRAPGGLATTVDFLVEAVGVLHTVSSVRKTAGFSIIVPSLLSFTRVLPEGLGGVADAQLLHGWRRVSRRGRCALGMADRLARPPAACTALGAYLGPPLGPAAGASFEEQELLVQVELAQSVLAFGELSSQPPPARLRYDRLLRARPNDRALRYKVTKLMLATGQREAAVAAVERACRHSAHSLAEAIVRTCLLTSASLYSGSALAMGPYDASNVNPKECILPAHRGRATAHIVELTQPDQPNALPSDDGRIFRAFNPSVLFLSAAEWSDRTSAGFAADGISRACCDAEPTHGGVAGADGYVNQEDVDCRGGGTAVLSKAPNMQVRELIADLSASLLVFFRISNVRSAWSFHVLASWQRHENDEWILAGVGEDVEGSQRHERPTCSQQEWESGEMHVDSEDSHTRARGEPSRVADADDDDIQIFSWRDTELDCELRIRKANGRHRDERDGTFVDTANTLKSGGRRR
eukprot:scaffold31183_cov31-Tisochrysis_lutea.AAC.2